MAQNLPKYSLLTYNPYKINPAAAGMGNSLEAFAGYRKQWTGIENAPQEYYLTASMPIYSWNSGVGMVFESQSIGLENYMKLGASYGYVLSIGRQLFSLSARASFSGLSFRGDEVITSSGTYEGNFIDHKDPILPIRDVRDNGWNFDLGLWYQNKSLRLGLSTSNIYSTGFQLQPDFNINPNRIYSLLAIYRFELNRDFQALTSLLAISDMNILQTQAAAYINYKESLIAGLSLTGYDAKSIEEMGISLGYRLNENLKLLYTFGIGLNELSGRSRGTHELLLGFDLGRAPGKLNLPVIQYNTRFLE